MARANTLSIIDYSFTDGRRYKRNKKRKSRVKTKKNVSIIFKFLIGGGIFVFALYFYNFSLTSPYFSLSDFKVYAEGKMLKKKISSIIKDYYGKNIFVLNIYGLKEKIEEIPEVEYVYIRKVIPNSLEIKVVEKKPFLILKNSKNYLVDDEGEKIEESYGNFDYKLPEIVAEGYGGEEMIELLPVEELKGFFKVFNSNNFVLHFNPVYGIVVIDGKTKIYLGVDNLVEKWDNYLTLKDQIKKEFGEIEYIDLRFSKRVYVKSRNSSGGVNG